MLKYVVAHFEVKVGIGIGITDNIGCFYISSFYFLYCTIKCGGTWAMGWCTSSKL